MNLMNNMYQECLKKFVLVFLDDILIYSRTKEEHDQYLRLELRILSHGNLYGKLYKWDFYTTIIQYLGHIISTKGIAIDSKKLEAILSWPTQKNVVEVISFMGLAGYYRIFVKEFSKILNPITRL